MYIWYVEDLFHKTCSQTESYDGLVVSLFKPIVLVKMLGADESYRVWSTYKYMLIDC